MENELEKIIKNLKKLLTKDFDFINAGRIVVASESREVNINMVNLICNELSIQTNHITKDQLKKIIEQIDLRLDYLEPEVPKVKRRNDWLKTVVLEHIKLQMKKYIFRS